jgi:hypothetical protein
MKHFCYVIVLSNGFEHWTRIVARSTEEVTAADWKPENLSQLLQHGWRPVRETPMSGGDAGYAYSLVLLEKD